jgi:hypothetical protein
MRSDGLAKQPDALPRIPMTRLRTPKETSMFDFVRPRLVRSARLLAVAGAAALVFACSQQPPAAPAPVPATGSVARDSSGAPVKTAAAKPPAGQHSEAGLPLPTSAVPPPPPPKIEPPDGKWLTDEQGRQYYVTELPKIENQYLWLNPEKTKVRLWYGVAYDVVGTNDKSFQVKVYRPEARVEEPTPAVAAEPTAAEKQKVEASYRNDTATSDRLTFVPFGNGLPGRGQWRNGFKIADMNGDGHPDIVHGPARKGNGLPVIFLGDGHGNWRRWEEVQFPRLAYDYGDVAVADFNGDGRPDLALGVHLRGLLILVADGPASFKEWDKGIEFLVPGQGGDASGFSSRTIEAADWNGDGRPDVIALGEGPRMAPAGGQGQARPAASSTSFGVAVYLNQGDGTWKKLDETKQSVQLFGDDLKIADFTGDHHLDMILGSDVLSDKEILRIGGDGGAWSVRRLEDLRPRSYVGAVDVGDFDGDGRLDLAVGYLSNELGQWHTGIDLFFNRPGTAGWQRKGLMAEDGRAWLTALASGDLDGDGNLDLAALTGDGRTLIFLGDGKGRFTREESPEIPAMKGACRGYDVKIRDLDGDPAGELVEEFAGEPSALFAPDLCPTQGAILAWKPQAKGAKEKKK